MCIHYISKDNSAIDQVLQQNFLAPEYDRNNRHPSFCVMINLLLENPENENKHLIN